MALLRILHIIYDDCNNPWLGGGGARRTFEIYSRFPADCAITILTAHYKGALRSEQVGRILYRRLGLPLSYLVSRITFTLAVMLRVRSVPHDVVVEDYTAFSPCFSFFFTQKRVIGSFQNLHSQKAAKGKGLFKALTADLFDAVALRNFRHLTAVSPGLTDLLYKRAKHKDNIRCIGVGIDQALFDIDRSAGSAAPYILYIGRIELYQKGIDVLLAAYEKLSPRPPLVLAGSGVDTKKAEEIVRARGMEKNVRFTGRFSNEEKHSLLRDAAFVVMPSRFEGYPVVPLEAMASGNAFIGTDIPGTRDVVGDCGIMVPSGDVDKLRDAMQRLLTDAAYRSTLERKGRDHARKFEWSSIAGQFHDFITRSMALHASAETARQ